MHCSPHLSSVGCLSEAGFEGGVEEGGKGGWGERLGTSLQCAEPQHTSKRHEVLKNMHDLDDRFLAGKNLS